MSKLYKYQYICFDIRNKLEIQEANQALSVLADRGYELYHAITENGNKTFSEIKVIALRKRL